jgi:hypothetical protein
LASIQPPECKDTGFQVHIMAGKSLSYIVMHVYTNKDI